MGWIPFLRLQGRSRHHWLLVILSGLFIVLLAVAGCGQVSGVVGAETTPSPTLTLKQAALATVAAQGTALASETHAPKDPGTETPITSCPMATPLPGIFAPSLPTQGFSDARVDNATAVMPADQPLYVYDLFAGSRKSNPQQGLLIVQRFLRDPCASPTPTGGTQWTYYNTPFQQGHVQMTGVAGDTVTFTTAGGGSTVYRFDFVTGHFL